MRPLCGAFAREPVIRKANYYRFSYEGNMTDHEMIKRMDKMEAAIMKVASRPSGGSATPAGTFGGYSSDWKSGDWPMEKLKKLAGSSYGSPAAADMFIKKHNGKPRLSGVGPAMVRLAALSGNVDARAMAKSQGMSEDYDDAKFEKEYGFTSVVKAKETGVQGINGEVRKVALAEGSGQSGGYVIPPQFMNELLTIAAEDGFIEQRAKIIPTTPYFGGILGQWQPEAQTINETEPAFKQSEWVAWDLVLYTVSSNQLLADNGIGLDALLTQLFGQAITWYKEFAYLQGKGAGSSMPLGVLNAPASLVVTKSGSAGTFNVADVAKMMSKLQIRSWDDACWIMHQSLLPQLIQMTDLGSTTAGAGQHFSWLTPFGDGKTGSMAMKMPTAFFNGLPLYFTEKLPSVTPGSTGAKGCCMLVDWSRYVIGMRLDLQIDVSPHYLFRNNQLAWRVIARCDGKPWLNAPITDQSGFTISPFVIFDNS